MGVDEKVIGEEVKVLGELNKELSEAIAGVLRRYDISGQYVFNVIRASGYDHKPVNSVKGKQLSFPLFCFGSGYATVENPSQVGPV